MTPAKELLQENFGNEYRIAAAHIDKALARPVVKADLRVVFLFSPGYCNVMEELQYMQELDMPANLRAIVTKFPFKFREKWRFNRRACFKDLVLFIEHQVKIISDPLFGDIQDTASGLPAFKSGNPFKHIVFEHRRRDFFVFLFCTFVDH